MKTALILLLTLGLALADPISKQSLPTDNNQPASAKCTESETKHEEETKSNKDVSEQKNPVNAINPIASELEQPIPNVEILIEEAIDLQNDLASNTEDDFLLDDTEQALADDLYPNEIMEKNTEEIMETAAGFVPLPIIRRRQKPQRRFASRRHYVRNPTRRVYYAYPYYPYYGYYRPSSLRYYY